MWPTTDGYRTLLNNEADLIRRVTGMMIDQIVAEGRDEMDQHRYDTALFDGWDWRQRLWLLDQVVVPLLTPRPAPDAAAVFEATLEAIFTEAAELVELEIIDPTLEVSPHGETSRVLSPTWRQSVFRVAEARLTTLDVPPDSGEIAAWRRLLDRLRESLFGPLSYVQAEPFRDGDYHETAKFLNLRGLPPDFLAKIPPLRSLDQTQVSIDRLQDIIFG